MAIVFRLVAQSSSFLLALGCLHCHGAAGRFKAAPWPSADTMFRGVSDWRGGDSAYSVNLGNERVLWLFGDSFVGSGDGGDGRGGRRLVRNSMAIQHGLNPARARIDFHYGGSAEEPEEFFSSGGEGYWLWPGPGVVTSAGLILTFTEVVGSNEGLGFQVVGSRAFVVENYRAAPKEWTLAPVALPAAPNGARFGTGSFLVDRDVLYSYIVVEPGNHDIYLVRWPMARVGDTLLQFAEWWSDGGWQPEWLSATPIVRDAQTEFTVARVLQDQFWMVSVDGSGGTNVVLRTAPRPEGRWSDPSTVFRPEESDRKGVLVYSAKAHALAGADVVITYCSNHSDLWTMAGDTGLYFPRFVAVRKER